FAALFHHLWHPVSSRYKFLLTGGYLLAGTAMGSYAVLLHIPATGSMLVLLSVSPARAHTWVFALQMSWQTLCHLSSEHSWVPSPSRPAVALSAIMLFTQKAMSLALDIHEGLMPLQLGQGLLKRELPLCSYLLFFPAVLGGPLCSFIRFQAQAEHCGALPCSLRATSVPWQSCTGLGCLSCIWAQALLLRLAYYLYWVLDEALHEVVGFGPVTGRGDVSVHDHPPPGRLHPNLEQEHVLLLEETCLPALPSPAAPSHLCLLCLVAQPLAWASLWFPVLGCHGGG
uniref:Uncharacterized protein n=1 Tax=Accipiter nisus TaxID=211598 RepID=A0A8B9NB39_9AVES